MHFLPHPQTPWAREGPLAPSQGEWRQGHGGSRSRGTGCCGALPGRTRSAGDILGTGSLGCLMQRLGGAPGPWGWTRVPRSQLPSFRQASCCGASPGSATVPTSKVLGLLGHRLRPGVVVEVSGQPVSSWSTWPATCRDAVGASVEGHHKPVSVTTQTARVPCGLWPSESPPGPAPGGKAVVLRGRWAVAGYL